MLIVLVFPNKRGYNQESSTIRYFVFVVLNLFWFVICMCVFWHAARNTHKSI